MDFSIGNFNGLRIVNIEPTGGRRLCIFKILIQICLNIGRVCNGAVEFFILQILDPFGGKGRIFGQIILCDRIFVVHIFCCINDGSTFDRDSPLIRLYTWIGIDAFCLHCKIQINRIAFVPCAIQDNISLFVRLGRDRFSIY